MKKILALLLTVAMLISVTACTGNVTMKKLIKANETEKLLETYDSVHIVEKINGKVTYEYYITKDYVFESYEDWSTYTSNDVCYYYGNGEYRCFSYISKDGFIDMSGYRTDNFSEIVLNQDSLKEDIQSVTEADGKLTVTTDISKAAFDGFVGSDTEFISASCEYVFDAKTRSMITGNASVLYGENETADITIECKYNSEEPEILKTMLGYINQKEDIRTVSVVFNAGTDKEKTEYLKAPKGINTGISLPTGSTEAFSVFKDAAFTQPLNEVDTTNDRTVYIRWDS